MGALISSLRHGHRLREAIRHGDLDSFKRIHDSNLAFHSLPLPFSYFSRKFTPLQIASFHSQLHILTYLLELGADPNQRTAIDGQTPLMLASKRGNAECVEKLLEHGGDVLAFDWVKGRTCLHMACRGGHLDCVKMILDAAQNSHVSATWGFERFVNVRDDDGAIPLHMASRAGNVEIVKLLLTNGALVIAVTSKSTYGPGHGSTPLHCAARSGSLDCVEELLAWGADRTYKDMMGERAYDVAVKRGAMECAAILDPTTPEPLVWPSPLALLHNLEPNTLQLLRNALCRSNSQRQGHPTLSLLPSSTSPPLDLPCFGSKTRFHISCFGSKPRPLICNISDSPPSPTSSDLLPSPSSSECMICFESSPHIILLHPCSHHLCPSCTIALCCHCKPNPNSSPFSLLPSIPSCPFCRTNITCLTIATDPLIHDSSA